MGWGPSAVKAVVRLGVMATTDKEDDVFVDSITLFVGLLCGCIVVGHFLENTRWLNESVTSLIIGLCTGGTILFLSGGRSSRILEFDEELFFIYLLPPIIFNAGFQVKRKRFFRNIITIMLFGAVGTLISFGIISFGAKELFGKLNIGDLELQDYLAIGAIFSATDSVCTLQVLNQDDTPFIYSVVFGEGVVNDATSIVLFNAIQKFDLSQVDSEIALQFVGNFLTLFVTSTLLGVVVGLLSAYIIKKLYFGRHSTDREVSLMMLMAYLSYVMAELFDMSGILTVFFCGIVMSHYTWHNVTQKSRVTTRHAFATISFISETFIFLYVGMDALDIEKWMFVSDSPGKSAGASAILLGLLMLGRAAFVFPLSFLSNCTKKLESDRIEFKQQVTIWWAGLMRGAVSMALAYNQFARRGHTRLPGNAIMITSTITIVLFSTMVFGLLTKPLITWLLPSSGHGSNAGSPKSFSRPLLEQEPGLDAVMSTTNIHRPSSLRMMFETPANTVHYYWRKFDNSFMRPAFGGRGFVPFIPGSPDGSPTERNMP
ncbi:secondary carrier transporter [Lithospermum erythrorhizon]|uniref:Sodium/hydrogen exchanger n=1 Tax=Lithospermum erythrorhizon TaxID=34254 RepID=A0AAV3NME5_LITER